jgi:4,5-DOPA dioxygenase extradiol
LYKINRNVSFINSTNLNYKIVLLNINGVQFFINTTCSLLNNFLKGFEIMMPSIFLCHGGPNLVFEKNDYTDFLKELGRQYTPKAIVIFTSHWESDTLSISFRNDTYDMIYDFGGFQRELYSFVYPAIGSTEVASELQAKLESHGIITKKDTSRGLDHGAWVMLYLMYPEANIPIVQVSVNPKLSLEEQYKIGQSIQELGKEDIMIIGSGATVHNLSTVEWEAHEPKAWAMEFDNWLIGKVEKKDLDSLYNYEKLAPYAKLAVPRNEHLVPLFTNLGCGEKKENPKLLHRSYDYGALSYICFEL